MINQFFIVIAFAILQLTFTQNLFAKDSGNEQNQYAHFYNTMSTEQPSLTAIRSYYKTAHADKSDYLKLYEAVGGYSGSKPLLLAYKASAIALKGKYSSSPITKVQLAKSSLSLLDSLVAKHPDHTEIRFLRLAIENNVPGFLNMSGHVESDKTSIVATLTTYHKEHPDMGIFILQFLIKNDLISEDKSNHLQKEMSYGD